MNHDEHTLRVQVMDAIHKGRVHMRPRWHFILHSAFGIVGSLLVFLTLLYVASLAVFFTRESGAFFAPSFGLRGWFVLLHGLPWLLIFLLVIFVILLELLVRRYAFVYRKPMLASIVGIVVLIAVGGLLIAQTPFHRQLFLSARHEGLPPPIGMLYGHAMRPPRGGEVYHGTITSMTSSGFVLSDIEGEGTTTIVITPQTRLPYGADFVLGDMVVVVGDETATNTVQAFGISEIGE
jgi:hypothetical protein